MTTLQCTAVNCRYNEDKYCCKGDIMVEGKDAMAAGETCCSSFVERGTDNACSCGAPKKEIQVACKACNCTHNENDCCKADHIGIAGTGACTCQETQCMTFCCN